MSPVEQTGNAAVFDAGSGSANKPDFRFYDNRQKYLMFVNTCSEKWVVAERAARELKKLSPEPPALRLFDAGIGDGTVLARLMRSMHELYPRFPFFVAGKEISLEDVRLALDKMPDRFFEHPETVLAITNISYSEAPWLLSNKPEARERMVWKAVALRGTTTAEFERQILGLQSFLAQGWRTKTSPTTGSMIPETPTTLVLYREDCTFILNEVIPTPQTARADYDLVVASQPFRLSASTEFKARRVLAPLSLSLRENGRLFGIHSAGGDPGLEIIQQVWPGENPFVMSRHTLLEATRAAMGGKADNYIFDPLADSEALFRYRMHTLPDELDNERASIGTSTLLAAWNAATYVAQIDDARLAEAMSNAGYLDATRKVLRRNGELWFRDESYVIVRRPHLGKEQANHDGEALNGTGKPLPFTN